MRKANGQLYLIDFGIARHFTPGQSKDTGPLGSPGYAAPEQYGRAQTTIQTDIYGLGATLQALLTGDDPSSTTTAANSTIQSPLPKKLTQLLDQMLETDVRKRPKSMEEVRNRLQDIKDGWKKKLASFTLGLLIGSMPYSLLLPLLMLNGPGFNSIIVSLYFFLLCTWPIALLGQVSSAISFVFVPRKRFLGLGILAMLIFLMLGFMYGFLPLPFSGPL
jgi:serine/threonine protein kinase